MARNRVQYIVSADSEEAVRAVEKFLLKEKEAGVQSDRLKEQGKSAFDDIGKSVVSTAAAITAGLGAYEAIQNALDQIRQSAAAVKEEMREVTRASESYGEASGKLLENSPFMDTQEFQKIDRFIRGIAAGSSIGEGGATRLMDAYTTVQSAMQGATTEEKMSVITEVAQSMELTKTTDASGKALGIAKLMEGSKAAGAPLTANQAQNFLAVQQSMGLIERGDLIGEMMPKLGTVASAGGISMPEAMVLAAATTQGIGDNTGEQTSTLLRNMAAKFKSGASEFSRITGVEIGGKNLLDDLETIRRGVESGEITPEEMRKGMPIIGAEGAAGASFFEVVMKGEAHQRLQEGLEIARSDEFLGGDITGQKLGQKWSLPGQRNIARRDQVLSQIDAERIANEDLVALEVDAAILEAQLRSELKPDDYIETAKNRLIGDQRHRIHVYGEEGRIAGPAQIASARGAGEVSAVPGVSAANEFWAGAEPGGFEEAIPENYISQLAGGVGRLVEILNPNTAGQLFREAFESSMRRAMEAALRSQPGGRVRPIPDQ